MAPDYSKFPSNRPFQQTEIEGKYIKPKFRREREIPWWVLGLMFMIVLTLFTLFVGRIVDDQAHAAEVSRQTTYSTLCTQYKADMSLTGTEAGEELTKLCN